MVGGFFSLAGHAPRVAKEFLPPANPGLLRRALDQWRASMVHLFQFSLSVRGTSTEIRHRQPQVSRIRRVGQPRIQIDRAGPNQLFDLAVEVLHAFALAILHGFEQRLPILLALFYILSGP